MLHTPVKPSPPDLDHETLYGTPPRPLIGVTTLGTIRALMQAQRELEAGNSVGNVVMTMKCVSCGERREVRAGETLPGDVPMCHKCFSPMVPHSARAS